MQQLNTSLLYTNVTDFRGKAMAALIKQYLNLDTDYGQLLLTTPNLRFPHIFVDPRGGQATALSTIGGKYQIEITYMISWFVVDNSPQDVVSLCTSIEEALFKLFSVNALDDIGTTHTQHFCSYDPYWQYVEFGETMPTPTFPNPLSTNDTEAWMRAGRMPIKTIQYGVNK